MPKLTKLSLYKIDNKITRSLPLIDYIVNSNRLEEIIMDMDLTVEDVRRILESKKDKKFKIKNLYDNNLISIQDYVRILKDYPSREYEQ